MGGGVRGFFNLEVSNELPLFPLWVFQLLSPGRSPAAARDGNEIPKLPSSMCTQYRERGKLLTFKGVQLSYGLSPSLRECLSASVLSEFLLPWICCPFYPALSSPSVLQHFFTRTLPLVCFFSIFMVHSGNFLPVLVFVTSFTSIVLLGPTRPLNPKRATGF